MQDGPNRRPIAIDVFAGCGGLSLGLEQAGFDVALAVDVDPSHCLTYSYNHASSEVLCADIREVAGAQLRDSAVRGVGDIDDEIDCLAGGPSCQGFSAIGRRDPSDSRNDLIGEFARLVEEIQPRYFIMENVPGLLGSVNQTAFADLTGRLTDAGYNLGTSPWKLDASAYGTPQKRLRVFLVGARTGLPVPAEPEALGAISSREAIGDLGALSVFPRTSQLAELSDDELAALDRIATEYVQTLRAPSLGLAAPRDWDRRMLTGVAGTRHSDDVVARFAALAPGRRDPVSRMPRLAPDSPSPTLRAGTTPDHGSFTSVRPVHYDAARVITVREAARLHSFPDWYRFHETRWVALRQIGNAVPPALARAVGGSIVKAMSLRPPVPAAIQLGDAATLGLSLSEAADRLAIDRSSLPRRSAA